MSKFEQNKMKNLTIDQFAGLVCTDSVHRVFLTPYPAIDGGRLVPGSLSDLKEKSAANPPDWCIFRRFFGQ